MSASKAAEKAAEKAEKALACDSESLHNAYYQAFIYNRKRCIVNWQTLEWAFD